MIGKKIPIINNRYIVSILLLLPYVSYLVFIISYDRGPVDYETFISIGSRFLADEPVYTTNSYYPMPFVMIFAMFALLPRPLSMALWMIIPVFAAWLISGRKPYVFLFAPLFGHFVGGQSSVFGMIGLWGYRKYQNSDKALAGVFLALTLLKPQLGLIPLAYSITQWIRSFRINKKSPSQIWGFMALLGVLYLPGFLIDPEWASKWLSTPRPLFERALSGFVPRTLFYLIGGDSIFFWFGLAVVSIMILILFIYRFKSTFSIDLAVVWGFIVNPLVHDYDLIQLVPILDTPALRRLSVLLSIPGWFVILFAYSNDQAWYVFSLIAPGLAIFKWITYRNPLKSSGAPIN